MKYKYIRDETHPETTVNMIDCKRHPNKKKFLRKKRKTTNTEKLCSCIPSSKGKQTINLFETRNRGLFDEFDESELN